MSNKKPYVIGVAGGSGSGKTFFLNAFLNHFTPAEVCLVSQDDYYIPQGPMTPEENRLHNFDLPTCFEVEQFEQDVFDLLSYKTVRKQEYTFNNPKAQAKLLTIQPAPILILEGLFIYHFKKINEIFDYRIFIDATAEIALERRLKRDLVERGYSHEDVMYKWENHVMPAFNQFLMPHRKQCDVIIDNNSNELANILSVTENISADLRQSLKL
ncbi:uridine kinase family protein [Pelobium manganitolerans]|uniref:uridine kinase family protein n=1 Tax=Pelobium manganitolerans TaxID=1842495 RepID=UPI003FA3623A